MVSACTGGCGWVANQNGELRYAGGSYQEAIMCTKCRKLRTCPYEDEYREYDKCQCDVPDEEKQFMMNWIEKHPLCKQRWEVGG
jgi:hypothetical protein